MIRTAILTISDSAVRGLREDRSGPALEQRCRELGWEISAMKIVADEEDAIAEQLCDWADNTGVSLILTTGGTGVAARDVTPEATRRVLQHELPGIAELMRAKGLEQTKLSALSRAVAGTRGRTLIVNLPGSPRGALHSFDAIRDLVPHAADLLSGRTEHG
ncbi:MAG TPA: MogA/MoaB family molybdenum cofactor biosynthesis protein [Bryobacteraceae bacterium]